MAQNDIIEENNTTIAEIIQQINDLQARVNLIEKAALTATVRTDLINLLANVAYVHNAGKQYYNQLVNSLTIKSDDIPYIMNFDFTKSLEDKAGNVTPVLAAAEGYSAPQRTGEGIIFNQPTQVVEFGDIDPIGKTFEYDIANFSFVGNLDYHCRFLMFSNTSTGTTPFMYRSKYGYNGYGYAGPDGRAKKWSSQKWPGMQGATDNVINSISGKTVKLIFESQNSVALYINNIFIGRQTDVYYNSVSSYTDLKTAHYCKRICFGGLSSSGQLQTAGDQCYNLILSGFRVYENIVGD